MRLAMVADLAKRLQVAEMAAKQARNMAADLEDGAAEYPQTWRDEEAAVLDGLAFYYADGMWAEHREVPSVLAKVRLETSGHMIRPAKDTALDWRTYCPRHYLRVKGGVGADEVAELLGYRSESDLLLAIQQEVEQGGAGWTHGQCMDDAMAQAERDPDYTALVAEHQAAYQEACAAAGRCAMRAAIYRELAQAQDQFAATIRQAIAVLLAAPGETARVASTERTALPARATRKAIDRLDAPSIDERATAAMEAAGFQVRAGLRYVAEGAAILGEWYAEPVRALAAEGRAALAGIATEARASCGGSGRHARRSEPRALVGILALAGVR